MLLAAQGASMSAVCYPATTTQQPPIATICHQLSPPVTNCQLPGHPPSAAHAGIRARDEGAEGSWRPSAGCLPNNGYITYVRLCCCASRQVWALRIDTLKIDTVK